jgi:pSer/pThr/pTyr-binding forkhead associated (FHA) protein
VANPGTGEEQRIAFCRVLEIDRDNGREAMPGLLLVQDPLVSRRHCVLTRSPDGRCYVRDVSLNGTHLSGRQLVPNVETEIHPGEVLTIAGGHRFVLDAAPREGKLAEAGAGRASAKLAGVSDRHSRGSANSDI